MPPLRYKCVNRIPYARGMGSSSAAIIAGLIGGLVLAGHQLPMWGAEELLQLACEIEVKAHIGLIIVHAHNLSDHQPSSTLVCQIKDRRQPYNTGTEHVGFSHTTPALLGGARSVFRSVASRLVCQLFIAGQSNRVFVGAVTWSLLLYIASCVSILLVLSSAWYCLHCNYVVHLVGKSHRRP